MGNISMAKGVSAKTCALAMIIAMDITLALLVIASFGRSQGSPAVVRSGVALIAMSSLRRLQVTMIWGRENASSMVKIQNMNISMAKGVIAKICALAVLIAMDIPLALLIIASFGQSQGSPAVVRSGVALI